MIVVTGASRGIGKELVNHFSNKGEHVVSLVRRLSGGQPSEIECDVAQYNSVKQAAKQIKLFNQPIKAVINAAGVASMNMAILTDEATVHNLVSTNLIGTINCCQLLGPLLLRQKSGLIINFSTIAVPLGLKGESVYAATKSGVETFSRVFARETADFGVRVNCIAPGPIETDLLRGLSKSQIHDVISKQIIQKQFAKSDICDLVEILLDERSSSITGQVLYVGGV